MSVVDRVLVVDDCVLHSLLQISNKAASLFEIVLVTVNANMLLHDLLHLSPNRRDSFALLMLQNPVIDSLLLLHRKSLNGVSEARRPLPGRVLSRPDSTLCPEQYSIAHRVSPMSPCYVHDLACH